jgi:hypothetical protein
MRKGKEKKMADDYIKKADAYRIAVHGTDPDVAYKIQLLQPEKVIEVSDMTIKVTESGMDWSMTLRGILTAAEKCDKVEVEE